jgi:hypothetical protein
LSIIARRGLLLIATRGFEFGFDLLFGFWGLLRQMSAVTAVMTIKKKLMSKKNAMVMIQKPATMIKSAMGSGHSRINKKQTLSYYIHANTPFFGERCTA